MNTTESQSATYSERILEELLKISAANQVGMFEAAAEYCETHDLEESDFLKHLDKNAVEQIRASAIREGKVRKCVAKPVRVVL